MLREEVAALFELTSSATVFYVVRLGREVNLERISVQEAEQLLALPGGFQWLRRKELPVNSAGPVASTTGPAKGKKRKKGA